MVNANKNSLEAKAYINGKVNDMREQYSKASEDEKKQLLENFRKTTSSDEYQKNLKVVHAKTKAIRKNLKPWDRKPEQQEYRDNLARDLKNLRQYGDAGKHLADILLKNEKKSSIYEWSNSNKPQLQQQQKEKLNDYTRELIDKGDFDSVKELVSHGYKDYDAQTADKLSELGYIKLILENMTAFESLGNVTYDKLKEELRYDTTIKTFFDGNFNKFTDYNYIVEDWISHDLLYTYNYYLKFCKGLNKQTLEKLLSRKMSIDFMNENVFTGLDDESFVKMLDYVKPSTVKYLKDAMKCFRSLNKDSFLYIREMCSAKEKELWAYGDYNEFKNAILDNLEIFELDEEIAENLIEAGYGNVVAKHPEKFGLKKVK